MAISGQTELFGIIGYPVEHSFSPAMQNAAFQTSDIDAVYLPFPVSLNHVASCLHGLKNVGVRGLNVTIPHKQTVLPLLDKVDEAATVIGAVNTIAFSDGLMCGYNTDWSGFLADLSQYHVDLVGRDCLVLGAGGSARAIVYGLLKKGAIVHLAARRLSQAQQLKDEFGCYIDVTHLHLYQLNDLASISTVAPLIVNTTPLGMWPNIDDSVWPNNISIPKASFIYDLIYNPSVTQLMKQGELIGCEVSNGLGMLLYQGVHAFKIWTGKSPDLTAMRSALFAKTTIKQKKI